MLIAAQIGARAGRVRSSAREGETIAVMTTSDPNAGWSDPIGTFLTLRAAVRILAAGESPRKVRLDHATSVLASLSPLYFPKRIREKAEKILSIRRLICDQEQSKSFRFDCLKPKECDALIQDILNLYEVCIFDMSEEIKAIVRLDDEKV